MAYKLERFATRWVEGVTKLYLKLIPIIGNPPRDEVLLLENITGYIDTGPAGRSAQHLAWNEAQDKPPDIARGSLSADLSGSLANEPTWDTVQGVKTSWRRLADVLEYQEKQGKHKRSVPKL